MNHCILLLQHLFNHVHFVTNGYKRFSKTNSTDPRQRVPLKGLDTIGTITQVIVSITAFLVTSKGELLGEPLIV